jgi:hypothetical protein
MPPPAKPGEPQPSEMKLTWIRYEGHMLGSRSAKDTDVVVFNGGVQLINMPADDPNVEINVDLLPPGALYIRCNTLKALNHKRENKADYKEFEATQRVVVRAKEFRANCDVLKYDESKDDLLILEGLGDNVATLYRQRAQGGEYEPTRAKKIWYYRKTGQVEVDGPQIIEIKP